eukprot:5337458-Prymnesium_polylepis.1
MRLAGRRDVCHGAPAPSMACAIVPLYPNELTPPSRSCVCSAATWAGIVHSTAASANCTCELSFRKCLFGAASKPCSPAESLSSPVSPAAGSAWPMLALTPPTSNGVGICRSARSSSTEATSDRTSIGSPKAVPVPCASLIVKASAPVPASTRVAIRRPSCALPLGAVRLADRPS